MKKTNLAKLTRLIKNSGENFVIRVSGYDGLNLLKLALKRNGYELCSSVGTDIKKAYKDFTICYFTKDQISPFYVTSHALSNKVYNKKLLTFGVMDFEKLYPSEVYKRAHVGKLQSSEIEWD